MKLKKIASLALAGVMAVSMLAGCKGNDSSSTGDQGNTTVETTATGIAKAFNDAQIAGNKVKIDFTSDSKLNDSLTEVAKRLGAASTVTVENFGEELELVYGVLNDGTNDYADLDGLVGYGETISQYSDAQTIEEDCEKGKTTTVIWVQKIDKNTAVTEDAAMAYAAQKANDEVAELLATTKVEKNGSNAGTPAGHTYYDFSYTGKAGMTKVVDGDGITTYYVVAVVEQTCNAVVK